MNSSYPKSVYRDDIYKAFFRDGEYSWVHCLVLKRHPELDKRIYGNPDEPWPWCVDLKEFEHDTGHSIIHYLYTGNYQCLQPAGLSPEDSNQNSLAEGLLICIAAESLGLLGLHALGVKEVEELGDKMSLPAIFKSMEDSDIALGQVPSFDAYLQNRMVDAKFGAPGQAIEDVLDRLASVNSLGTLALKAMVLQHKRRTENEGSTHPAEVEQADAKTDDPSALSEQGVSAALLALEAKIRLLVEKKSKRGGRLLAADGDQLRNLQLAAEAIRCEELDQALKGVKTSKGPPSEQPSLDEAKKAEALQEKPTGSFNEVSFTDDEAVSKSKSEDKGKIEAWLRLDPDSYHARLPGLEDNRSDYTVSATEMTPSSKGSSWDVFESGSEE
ncbi:hypothetical protein NW752_007722 [Fusarium irregulare]|uniref:BTB domain-containing protein n=1 Tax=Fusarium irregulare TaxID=2494466 RepID=A0A9W8PIL0_9HYPO|nr:hypothetical protein NW766_009981 [Fusarium irregulare]KAJ4013424.1 hypothetical protein NW752_007722 [Fusarium irregulare]